MSRQAGVLLQAQIDRPVEAAWPDWRGETVAILASGPSLKSENIEALRGRVKIVAIKQCVDRCMFADAVYGCDDWWWRHRHGLPEFPGSKFAFGARACADYPDIRKVTIRDVNCDRLLFDEVGSVAAGGNSGFQALNLVLQFGAARVLLIGFDMHDRGGVHWYGRNNWLRANNPDESNFTRWKNAFDNAAAQIERDARAQVVNCSPVSDLTCFPKRSAHVALTSWGL